MNRETWFRILQVAVVAPFLYSMSDDQKNAYFRLGLKLVAGSIIIMNMQPLFDEVQPLLQAALKMKAEAEQLSAQQKTNAIEGEYSNV